MKLLKFLSNKKKISAALFLTNGVVFLSVTPTFETYYDLPKGVQNEGEDILETLIREVSEETGINLQQYRNKIQKMGKYLYREGKDIILFALKLDDLPETSSMKCTSMFEIKDKQYPEVGQFKYIDINNLNNFKSNMRKIIKDVLKKI